MAVKKRENGKWQARYRGPDRKERARDFGRKVDAERWLREQTAKIDRGEWTDPLRGRVTVGDYSEEWLRGKLKIKPSTRTSYESLLRIHVLPAWGDVPLSNVRHEDVRAWVQRMHASGLSASKTRQAHVMLAGVLDLAVRTRRIPSNPARGDIDLPSLPPVGSTGRALDEREVWGLAEAAGDDRLSVLVLAWCGLRFGEMAGLRVRNFDALGRSLRVEVTLSEVNGKLHEGPPKTTLSKRTVPVPVWLVEELAPLLAGKDPDDYLLTAPDGGPLRIGNWRTRVFDPAVRAAGIAGQVKGDVVRPHDLRHTCATLHLRNGTPIKVVSVMLGHASVSITVDRYGHLLPGDALHHVDRLGERAVESRADWMRTNGSRRVLELAPAAGGKGL